MKPPPEVVVEQSEETVEPSWLERYVELVRRLDQQESEEAAA